MKTKQSIPVTNSEKRLVATKERNKKATTSLCFNCEEKPISPYETGLCDFCADDIRWRPRLSDLF